MWNEKREINSLPCWWCCMFLAAFPAVLFVQSVPCFKGLHMHSILGFGRKYECAWPRLQIVVWEKWLDLHVFIFAWLKQVQKGFWWVLLGRFPLCTRYAKCKKRDLFQCEYEMLYDWIETNKYNENTLLKYTIKENGKAIHSKFLAYLFLQGFNRSNNLKLVMWQQRPCLQSRLCSDWMLEFLWSLWFTH